MKKLLLTITCLSCVNITAQPKFLKKQIELLNQELSLSSQAQNPTTKLLVLWDQVFKKEGITKDEAIIKEVANLSGRALESDQMRLRLLVLKNALKVKLLGDDFPAFADSWSRETFLSYYSLKENYSEFLPDLIGKSQNFSVQNEFQKSLARDEWSGRDIKNLINFEPRYSWGFFKYRNEPTLYMFCRHNREHPCLMVMKDKNGRLVREANGQVWSQPKLALSGRGLPSHQVNGHTPQGVYLINSVMPSADQQKVFGKYRRLKLDFVESSRREKKLLRFIPDSLQKYSWWRENVVARDVGRILLRIHGTGLINDDPASSWYPFYPTSGCVASRENTYDGVTYKDQRLLLDTMMNASGLRAQYANETSLTGLLYVVNIDSKEEAVTLEEIAEHL